MNFIREKVNNSFFEAIYAITGAYEATQILLEKYPTLNKLRRATYGELIMVSGIGDKMANRIIGACALANHANLSEDPVSIYSPEDSADLVQYEMSELEQEELRVILLNTRNHVLGIKTIYKGSLNSSQVRVGEIFKPAIRENAAAIIIVHNHPSGDPSPSPDDVAITKIFIQAGKMLDIQVLDHLIIGRGSFISLNRRGLGFSED